MYLVWLCLVFILCRIIGAWLGRTCEFLGPKARALAKHARYTAPLHGARCGAHFGVYMSGATPSGFLASVRCHLKTARPVAGAVDSALHSASQQKKNLPAGWKELADQFGKKYYVSPNGQSSWEFPSFVAPPPTKVQQLMDSRH